MNCILSTAISICRSLHKGAISRTALWNIVISFHFRFNSIALEFYNIVLGFCYCNTYFSYQIPRRRHVRAYYSKARNSSQKFLGKLWAQHHYVLRSTLFQNWLFWTPSLQLLSFFNTKGWRTKLSFEVPPSSLTYSHKMTSFMECT